jgi:ketol-acid reductoisomerase
MTSDRWIKAHTTENIFETDMIRDALEREGIEYVVKEHKDTAYDGLFVLQKGYATIFVEEENEAAAKAIIKGIKGMLYVASSDD